MDHRRYEDEPVNREWVAELGKRVRSIRELTRLTAEQVDTLADLEPGTVAAIESGAVEYGGWTLLAVADAMGVTVDFLMDVGGSDPFERYGRVSRGIVDARERAMGRTAPVYRGDNLPCELVESARLALEDV